ncbi:MAG: hypothetical protein DIJKHBIC_04399 [Thermoanaerobaculia bacterium]|nr:hypothetical protein [Thermoanaerobaculia bacterium]
MNVDRPSASLLRKVWGILEMLWVICAAPNPEALLAQSILTIAGGGSDDGRHATLAAVSPSDVSVDSQGNLFIADWLHKRVRRVDGKTGTISTAAGNGASYATGDGEQATLAGVDPFGIAIDDSGNLFIVDHLNYRIRRVDGTTGVITTVAGSGKREYFGDSGAATAAGLGPRGVAVSGSGDLFIADGLNYRVRRVDAKTGIITTIAGNGIGVPSGDGGPASAAGIRADGVDVDRDGNLFVGDVVSHVTRRVDGRTGIITTVANRGSSFAAVDSSGSVFIPDWRVWRVDGSTGVVTAVAGNGSSAYSGDGGPATAAGISARAVAIDGAGNLFIADDLNHRVRRVDGRTGIVTTAAGNGHLSHAADVTWPAGLAVDGLGNLFIGDTANNRVQRLNTTSGTITTVAGSGGLSYSGDNGPATAAGVFPSGLAVDSAGNLFIADNWPFNNRVRRVDAESGVITTVAGNGSSSFSGDGGLATSAGIAPFRLTAGSGGVLFVVDDNGYSSSAYRVRRVDLGTGVITTAAGNGNPNFLGDGGPATAAGVGPSGVATDGTRTLFIADSRNRRVRGVDLISGIMTTVAGNGSWEFSGDEGPAADAGFLSADNVAVDGTGNLFVSDVSRVRRIDSKTGIVTTSAGSGSFGFSGDGGPAVAAGVSAADLAVDRAGNLFVSDARAGRVRAVYACRTSLGAFDPSFPSDGIIAGGTALNIDWAKADGAFRYDLLLDTEFPPKKVTQQDVTGQGLSLSGLLPGKTYYWQVRAKGDPYCPAVERSSGVRRFTTAAPCSAPAPPVLENVTSQGTSAALKFGAASGAASYDVYLGSGTSPLGRIASGVPPGSFTATGLNPGTAYRWIVVARAMCNTALTSSSLEGEFRTSGTCEGPESVKLLSPSNASAGNPSEVVLRWSAIAGASSYDVYVDDGLVASGMRGMELPVALAPGRTYRWRVVAHAACDDSRTALSETWSFATVACATPAIPAGVASTKGNAQQGSTYTLTWSPAEGVESGGIYRIERAKGGDFTGAESFTTRETSLVLTGAERTTYFHRVAAQASCGTRSAWSSPLPVSVSAAPPFLTMTNPPKATVIAQPKAGLPLPKLEVEVRNTGTTDFVGYFNTSQTIPFFIMNETFFSLRAGEIRIFYLQFSGVPMNQPGQYEGTLSIHSQDPTDTTAFPQASISLNVTSNKGENPLPQTAAPVIQLDGKAVERLRFAPAGLGEVAPELTVDIKNVGSAPLDLAADVLPDPWVTIWPKGWNSVPIPPNATRTVRLALERLRGESGGSFPRQTYVTFRTIDGKSSRVLVEDPGPMTAAPCRGRSLLASGETSWIVPSLVSASGAGGVRFVSTVLLTNLGPETIQADLYYTPDVPGADGYDCTKVQVATLTVPGNDVLVLTDPVAQLFGTEGSGSLEIRSGSPGQLRITSFVDAPASGGGSFGFQLPVFMSGEGVRSGKPYVVTGVNHATPYRTNLILTETSGQTSSVTITLYDRTGKPIGSTERALSPFTKTQLSIGELSGSNAVNGGALEIVASEGSAGTVAPLITVIDGRSGDASSFEGIPLSGSASVLALPSVVTSTTFNSRVEVRNNTDRAVKYGLTYLGNTGNLTSPERTLGPRQIDVFENVLKDVFNLPSTLTSFGPLHVEAEAASLSVVSRVYVETPAGSYGDAIESHTLDDGRTTGESNRILIAEGLEGTAKGDRTRGARTNLILTEITGNPVEVEVTIWEKTQRRVAATGKLTLKLNGYEQRQINDIFGDAGFAIGEKDRANVMCQIRPKPGSTGRVIALATRIDNKTNDTKNLGLRP